MRPTALAVLLAALTAAPAQDGRPLDGAPTMLSEEVLGELSAALAGCLEPGDYRVALVPVALHDSKHGLASEPGDLDSSPDPSDLKACFDLEGQGQFLHLHAMSAEPGDPWITVGRGLQPLLRRRSQGFSSPSECFDCPTCSRVPVLR